MDSTKEEDVASSKPFEGEFLKAFMMIQTMVEEFYQDWNKGEKGFPSHIEGKREGGGEGPPKTPPSSRSFLVGSLPSFEKKKKFDGKIDFNMPWLKLDIKFELPIYNG